MKKKFRIKIIYLFFLLIPSILSVILHDLNSNEPSETNSQKNINPKINYAANQWENIGPYGGFLLDLAICNSSPNVLWGVCDTNGGVYKTVDGGENWECKGLEQYSTYSVAIDPLNPNKVFIGSSNGLYRTLNGGNSWDLVCMEGLGVLSVAINPYNHSNVYIGAFNLSKMDGTGFGVNRSINGGDAGTFYASGLSPNLVIQFTFDPLDDDNIYAATGSGIHKSENDGATWVNIPTSDYNPMRTVACAGNGLVYAGALNSSGKPGAVFKTDNDGGVWTLKKNFNGTVWDVIIDHNNTEHVYAAIKDNENATLGIWESIDGGENWERKVNGLSDRMTAAIVMDPTNNNTIYTATNGQGGVFKSIDGGEIWIQKANGMKQMIITALDTVSDNGKYYLYGATGLGIDALSPIVWKYNMSSKKWNSLMPLPLNPPYQNYQMISAWDIAISKQDSNKVYIAGAAHQQNSKITAGMVWNSLDGGTTWENPVYSFANITITSIALGSNETNGENIYITRSASDTGIFYGVNKSTDGGKTFKSTSGWYPGLQTFDVKVAPSNNSIIYAGTVVGLFKSEDYGNIWIPKIIPGDIYQVFYDLWVNPENANHVLAAVNGIWADWHNHGGIWETLDGGDNWEYLGLNISVSTVLSNDDYIFAGTCGQIYNSTGQDVWKSPTKSINWQRYDEESLQVPYVLDMVLGSDLGMTDSLFVSCLCDGISVYTIVEDNDTDDDDDDKKEKETPIISGYNLICLTFIIGVSSIYFLKIKLKK